MKHWRSYFIIGGFLVLLVIIQFRNPEITGPYKGILGNVLNPIVYVVNLVSGAVSGAWTNYVWLVGVNKENEELHATLNELMLENAIISERLIQMDNLNRLLDFKDTYAFSTEAANVIGRNTDGYMRYIIIDRGFADGINEGDPVVSASGLVGKVGTTYYSTSEVILLSHHESSVSVINSRTRAVGMLKGDGRGNLYVDYYDRLDEATTDDVFITSGMGQLFPKGIRCGNIRSISAPPTGLFQTVHLNGAVDYYKLEQVLVVVDQGTVDQGTVNQGTLE